MIQSVPRIVRPGGVVRAELFRSAGALAADVMRVLPEHQGPEIPTWLWQYRHENADNIRRGVRKILAAAEHGLPCFFGTLRLTHFVKATGEVRDYGIVSCRAVTNAGVAYLVDALQNIVEPELLKFHGIGTGTNAEAVGDTALQAELTTAYSTDSTRATGTTTEGAANVFRTVGTNTVDATVANTEHGVFSQSAAPGGTLLDRSVYAAVNLASGDSVQTTYDLTLPAGS